MEVSSIAGHLILVAVLLFQAFAFVPERVEALDRVFREGPKSGSTLVRARPMPVGSFAADLYFYIDYDLYFMQVTGRTTDPKEQS
jgi:hypothetical protein